MDVLRQVLTRIGLDPVKYCGHRVAAGLDPVKSCGHRVAADLDPVKSCGHRVAAGLDPVKYCGHTVAAGLELQQQGQTKTWRAMSTRFWEGGEAYPTWNT